jgi:hypothetical protein
MLIWFRIKALYVAAIAFGISFLWVMIAFAIFGSSMSEEALAGALVPMWVFIFGLNILLGRQILASSRPCSKHVFCCNADENLG